MIEFTIGVLLVLMIIGSLIALETKDLLSAVISFSAVGVFSSIIYLLVSAPDIAITQLVVEVLSLIILIRATIHTDLTTISGDREFFGLISTIAIIFLLFLFGIEAMELLPKFGHPAYLTNPSAPAHRYLAYGLTDTGGADIVTSVVLDYRAYDTFGEVTVLFTAILGALAIMRLHARKKKESK